MEVPLEETPSLSMTSCGDPAKNDSLAGINFRLRGRQLRLRLDMHLYQVVRKCHPITR